MNLNNKKNYLENLVENTKAIKKLNCYKLEKHEYIHDIWYICLDAQIEHIKHINIDHLASDIMQ